MPAEAGMVKIKIVSKDSLRGKIKRGKTAQKITIRANKREENLTI